MYATETESYFFLQEAEQPRWLAFLLALCVHGIVVAAMVFMPSLFVHTPVVEDVVSVSLVTMPEIGGAPAASPEAASGPTKPPVEKVEPPPASSPPQQPDVQPEQRAPAAREQVAVLPETAPIKPVVPSNPVSLAPEQRKIKKTQDTRLEEEKVKEQEQVQRRQEERELQKRIEERRREVERREVERKEAQRREEERKKALAQARLEQINAEKEARELAAQAKAADAVAAAVRADANRRTQAMQSAVTGSVAGQQQAQSIVEQTYWASVAQRVRSFWVLPEMRKWDANLLAMVVITINKNGEVTRIQFDQRSNDLHFDQLVEKTIKNASPMPRFPALMQQETTEVGFKFRPGELGNM